MFLCKDKKNVQTVVGLLLRVVQAVVGLLLRVEQAVVGLLSIAGAVFGGLRGSRLRNKLYKRFCFCARIKNIQNKPVCVSVLSQVLFVLLSIAGAVFGGLRVLFVPPFNCRRCLWRGRGFLFLFVTAANRGWTAAAEGGASRG